jgi:hypothetical protein
VNGAATLALFGAVLGGAAVSGRRYRRWSRDVNVLTAPRARVKKFRTEFRSKRANAREMGGLIGAMVVEIAQAARPARPR